MNENEVYGIKMTPEDMETLFTLVMKYGFGDIITALGLRMVAEEQTKGVEVHESPIPSDNV